MLPGLLGLLPWSAAWSQCGTLISTFPYSEGFETAASWVSGGTGNDWAWGTPAHPLINSAGGGTKCWCVGGLSGTFYSNNEESYLESPCFDFTTLDNPRISFKIFWEVERQQDGMTFQYSTDGGSTYSNAGSFGEAQDCITSYWFNTSDINHLPSTVDPKQGWSGRQGSTEGSCLGGNGSQGWVTARHCLGWLSNAPSVRFRFVFGSGSICNDYDGIAIDDIMIDESDPVLASFSADCTGSSVDFINTSGPCPSTYAWNFGDPGSAQNTSVQEDPTHLFSGPGSYSVSLTATDACGASGDTTIIIHVLGVALQATDPHCGQDNGEVQAVVTGSSGTVNYVWSPGGDTVPSLDSLPPGTYGCTVSGPNSCPATTSVTLAANPSIVALNIIGTDATCNGSSDGTAMAEATNGVAPYSFLWALGAATGDTIIGLAPGTYSCQVTDSLGCTAQDSIVISEPAPVVLDPLPPVSACSGSPSTLTANAGGGTGPYSYTWLPEGPQVSPVETTDYSVVATDAHGCSSPADTVTVTVLTAAVPLFLPSDTAGCSPLCITFNALPPLASAYHWDLGDGGSGTGSAVEHCYQQGGHYAVSLAATDANGCVGTLVLPDLIHVLSTPAASFSTSPSTAVISGPPFHFDNASIHADSYFWTFGDPENSSSDRMSPTFSYNAVGCYTVTLVASNAGDCSDTAAAVVCVEEPFALYMPNAFSPNDDDINEVLLPVTSVRQPKHFRMSIYDRWGGLVYTTTDLYAGWDGRTTEPGVYVWKIWITDAQGEGHEKTGSVTLLR
jgi:gliding motility-associated-like protein